MKPTKTRTILHRLLRHWVRDGEITIIDAHGTTTIGQAIPRGASEPLRATVTIHDDRAYGLLLRGSLGLAQGYRDGWWDADNLVAVVRIAARNIHRGDRYRRRLRPCARHRCTSSTGSATSSTWVPKTISSRSALVGAGSRSTPRAAQAAA